MANDIASLAGAQTFVVLPSAALTATPNTKEFEIASREAMGLVLVIDVTAIVTAPSITVKVEGVDRVSGKTFLLLTSAAISTVSTTVLRIRPGLTASANVTANDVLPPVIRITSTHANGNSITYSIAGQLTY